MTKVPNPSKVKEIPEGFIDNKEIPQESGLKQTQPKESKKLEETPVESKQIETTPEESKQLDILPEASPEKEEKPSDQLEENCVSVGDKKIEIKPTKLKYFRNKAASAYGIIKAVPLHELLTYDKGVIDATRDADQLLYDFLIAAFDDPVFVRDNYDDIDADTVDRIVKIFGRINHIDEKEEAARKNREAQAKR